MKRKNVMLMAVGGKLLAMLAREVVPVLLSVIVRDGIRKAIRKFKEKKAKPEEAAPEVSPE